MLYQKKITKVLPSPEKTSKIQTKKANKIVLTSGIKKLIVLEKIKKRIEVGKPSTEKQQNDSKEIESTQNLEVKSESLLFNAGIKAEIIKPTKMNAVKEFEKIKECPFIQEYKIRIINEGSFRIEKPKIEFNALAVSKCSNCNLNAIESQAIISFNACKKEKNALIEITAINTKTIKIFT